MATQTCRQRIFGCLKALAQVRRAVGSSQLLVLNASDPELKHCFAEGPVEAAYSNTYLANISGFEQGLLLQKWARKILQETRPKSVFSNPKPGTCCNGWRRGAYRAAYDFVMNGRKVEIKSSRMLLCGAQKSWKVVFNNIKISVGEQTGGAFDDLFLVIASPDSLVLIQHDLCTGMGSSGKQSTWRGLQVTAHASVNDKCWKDGLSTIVDKLCEKGRCKLVAERSFHDCHLQELLADCSDGRGLGQATYDGLPMCSMSYSLRGLRIQKMGLVIDKKMNPHSCFKLMMEEYNVCGRLRGGNSASCDWIRDGKMVELKSSKLNFVAQRSSWKCHFHGIKPECFQELWLAIYSPGGVRFYRLSHPEALPLGTAGLRTEAMGFSLQIYGPTGEEDPQRALEAIEGKLFSRGFTPQAVVEWEAATSIQIQKEKVMALNVDHWNLWGSTCSKWASLPRSQGRMSHVWSLVFGCPLGCFEWNF